MTGWGRYKNLVLAGSGGEETDINYMVSITFNANMNADFSDIRFVDSDGVTLLEQFRESYTDSTSAIYWIKVPSVSAGGKTVTMWYKNAGASLVSAGVDSFPLFDDFTGSNGDPPDPTKWAISDNDYVRIYDNKLRIHLAWTHLNQFCRSIPTFSGPYGVRCRMTVNVSGTGIIKAGFASNVGVLRIYYSNYTTTSRWNYGGGNEPATPMDSLVYQINDIRRMSLTRSLYFHNDSQEWDFTGASSDDLKIGIDYDGSSPSGEALFDWLFVYKLHSTITDNDSFPELGDEISVEPTGRNFLFAYQNDVTDWGTPVKALTGDQILPQSIGPLVASSSVHPDKGCGFAWNQYIYRGRIISEQTLKFPLRYSGRHLSFIAQVMGKDSVTGSGDYTHLFELLENVDDGGLFGSLYAFLGRETNQHIIEIQSAKPYYFSIEGPDNFGYVSLIVKLISDTINYNADALMEVADFASVDHLLYDGDLPKIIPFGSMRVRLNDYGDAALDTADAVKPTGFKLEVERSQVREWVARGGLSQAWQTDEPPENGYATQRLTLVFPDFNSQEHSERHMSQTVRKADVFMEYDAGLSILMNFPGLFPVVPDGSCSGQNRISHSVGFMPLEVAAAPSGMSLTKWSLQVEDQNANAYH